MLVVAKKYRQRPGTTVPTMGGRFHAPICSVRKVCPADVTTDMLWIRNWLRPFRSKHLLRINDAVAKRSVIHWRLLRVSQSCPWMITESPRWHRMVPEALERMPLVKMLRSSDRNPITWAVDRA